VTKMRWWIVGGMLLVVLVLVVFRQRLFLRDPLARVERNGIRQTEYRVYLNYFNDILVEDLERNQRYLVQAQQGVPLVPGFPLHLQCLLGIACLTERDFAPTRPLGGQGYAPEVEMTGSCVAYVNGRGESMRVSLR
jgi:hypothetical protein